MASFNSPLFIQSIPIASRAATMLQFPPPLTETKSIMSLVFPYWDFRLSKVWQRGCFPCGGTIIGKFASNNRWRRTRNPLNIVPQSMAGLINGAPSTFSITYGLPVFLSISRTGSISRGHSWPLPLRLARSEYDWHGGEACMASNDLRNFNGRVRASA